MEVLYNAEKICRALRLYKDEIRCPVCKQNLPITTWSHAPCACPEGCKLEDVETYQDTIDLWTLDGIKEVLEALSTRGIDWSLSHKNGEYVMRLKSSSGKLKRCDYFFDNAVLGAVDDAIESGWIA